MGETQHLEIGTIQEVKEEKQQQREGKLTLFEVGPLFVEIVQQPGSLSSRASTLYSRWATTAYRIRMKN
jgi:hypothetical protein